jgi:hypothetical protein
MTPNLPGGNDIDAFDVYIDPNSGIVAIGVYIAYVFIPVVVLRDSQAVIELMEDLKELLREHLEHNSGVPEPGSHEVPEVFRRAFDDSP